MKTKDVVVGNTYYTYIAGELAAVVVSAMVEGDPDSNWSSNKRTRFRVRREGENSPLPKLRTAAALREKNQTYF